MLLRSLSTRMKKDKPSKIECSGPSSEPIRQGYLLKKPQRLTRFKRWNERWFLLFANSNAGRVRLEYFDSEQDCHSGKGRSVIPLYDCATIKQVSNLDYQFVIELSFPGRTYYLAPHDRDEQRLWYRSLCKTVFGSPNRNSMVQLVGLSEMDIPELNLLCRTKDFITMEEHGASATRGEPSKDDSPLETERDESTVTPYSEIMPSSSIPSVESYPHDSESAASPRTSEPPVLDGGGYHVSVRTTVSSQRCGLEGHYLLSVEDQCLVLRSVTTQNHVREWPIFLLKRYGRGKGKFSFEAYDTCSSGPGIFTFNTFDCDTIFSAVDQIAQRIKQPKVDKTQNKRSSLPVDAYLPELESGQVITDTKLRHKSEWNLDQDGPKGIQEELAHFGESINDVSMISTRSTSRLGDLKLVNASSLAVISDVEELDVLHPVSAELVSSRNSILLQQCAVEDVSGTTVEIDTPVLCDITMQASHPLTSTPSPGNPCICDGSPTPKSQVLVQIRPTPSVSADLVPNQNIALPQKCPCDDTENNSAESDIPTSGDLNMEVNRPVANTLSVGNLPTDGSSSAPLGQTSAQVRQKPAVAPKPSTLRGKYGAGIAAGSITPKSPNDSPPRVPTACIKPQPRQVDTMSKLPENPSGKVAINPNAAFHSDDNDSNSTTITLTLTIKDLSRLAQGDKRYLFSPSDEGPTQFPTAVGQFDGSQPHQEKHRNRDPPRDRYTRRPRNQRLSLIDYSPRTGVVPARSPCRANHSFSGFDYKAGRGEVVRPLNRRGSVVSRIEIYEQLSDPNDVGYPVVGPVLRGTA